MLHVDGDPVQDLTQLSQLLPVRQALVTQYGLEKLRKLAQWVLNVIRD